MADHSGQQLANYRLLHLLGAGGFAEVYLGEHLYLGSQAAVKLLFAHVAPEDIAHFQQEAQMVSSLMHPHIVRVLDFGVQENTPYLVMDYAPGGTLRRRHPKGTQLPLSIVNVYVKQVAQALQYAHDHKLIHRDVKPENMLLGQKGEVLLSDFGIALVAQSSRYQSTQDLAGTLAYMAPEQIERHPRPASDQYALGIVVYEWLCGTRPFHGSVPEMAIQHTIVPPPPLRDSLPELSPAIEEVVMIALAKKPQDRFSSVQAFATALEQASLTLPYLSPASSEPFSPVLPGERSVEQTSPISPMPASPISFSNTINAPELHPAARSSAIPLPSAPGVSTLVEQRSASSSLPVIRRKPFRNLILILMIVLLIGMISSGIYLLSNSRKSSSTSLPVGQVGTASRTGSTSTTPPAISSATPVNSATAMGYYNQYTHKLPAQEIIPSNSSQWSNGSPSYGICENEGTQGFHAIPYTGSIVACLAPSPVLTGDFAVQATMTVLQGTGAGLVFGYSPSNNSSNHQGEFYYWSFCRIAGCPPQNVFLYYGLPSGRTLCLGPDPGPGYTSDPSYCNFTSPAVNTNLGQPNILTVIVLHGEIYLYVNATFILSINPFYPTSGQVGIAAVAGRCACLTDVTFQNLKIWPVQG